MVVCCASKTAVAVLRTRVHADRNVKNRYNEENRLAACM